MDGLPRLDRVQVWGHECIRRTRKRISSTRAHAGCDPLRIQAVFQPHLQIMKPNRGLLGPIVPLLGPQLMTGYAPTRILD